MIEVIKMIDISFKTVRWKNKEGITKELIVESNINERNANGFLWRLSIATLSNSSNFSCFPGINRTLLLLKGKGLELNYNTYGNTILSESLKPVSFPGEWNVYGRLLNGPCLDFNIMSCRRNVKHNVSIISPVRYSMALLTARVVTIFCLSGIAYILNMKLKIMPGELLKIEFQNPYQDIDIISNDRSTILIIVTIDLF